MIPSRSSHRALLSIAMLTALSAFVACKKSEPAVDTAATAVAPAPDTAKPAAAVTPAPAEIKPAVDAAAATAIK